MTTTAIPRILNAIKFNEQGLIAAVAQDAGDGRVLMVAWMNAQAVRETLTTHRVTYFSRSRQTLWRKGETSGQIQELVSADLDCDGDAVLLKVRQTGVACHTGRRSCFYRRADGISDTLEDRGSPLISPETLYGKKP